MLGPAARAVDEASLAAEEEGMALHVSDAEYAFYWRNRWLGGMTEASQDLRCQRVGDAVHDGRPVSSSMWRETVGAPMVLLTISTQRLAA